MKHGKIIIAEPHGFCSGVRRAIETIEAALNLHKPPVYCLHEIVHNDQVVKGLAERGVRFVEDLAEIPDNATLLFSAHGVPPETRLLAKSKRLNVIDATCPFVSKVHAEASRFAAAGLTVIIVGQRNHEEVAGVSGEAPGNVAVVENEEDARAVRVPDENKVGVVCQTTLSASFVNNIISILRGRFPTLLVPKKSDICYATQNRQRAVQALAGIAELILVLGSGSSANTRKLVEVGEAAGCRSIRVGTLEEFEEVPLSGIRTIGLTSGASTPEFFLVEVTDRLREKGFDEIERLVILEESSSSFPLPVELNKQFRKARRSLKPR